LGGSKAVEMTANWNNTAGTEGGARVELGIWPGIGGTSALRDYFRTEGNSIFISSEVYLPDLVYASAGNPWASIYDSHMHWPGGDWGGGFALYILQPGQFTAVQDRGKLMFENSAATSGLPGNNRSWSYTSQAMPVGQWFCLEWEYKTGTNANGEFRVYFDDTQVLEELGVSNLPSTNLDWMELYWKWYGDAQSGGTVVPALQTIYRRNMRVTDYRTKCQ